jgi:hypothetical protein
VYRHVPEFGDDATIRLDAMTGNEPVAKPTQGWHCEIPLLTFALAFDRFMVLGGDIFGLECFIIRGLVFYRDFVGNHDTGLLGGRDGW